MVGSATERLHRFARRQPAGESNRASLVVRLFSLVQRGDIDCAAIETLHAEVLALEQAQWDAAVKLVEQRIFH
ncbi:MAG: hypothetical protein ACU85U_06610 [Gammaproteobacteria bacterium]